MSSSYRNLSVSSSNPETEDDRLNQCDHCMVVKRVCYLCKMVVEEKNYGRPFNYVHKGLRLSDEFVKSFCRKRTETCFSTKKLHLVLDLDHTLIHSCRIERLSSNNSKCLIEGVGLRDDLAIIITEGHIRYVVKLRPFVREFLREASDLFEMYAYTKASKLYATEIVRLLDPQGMYFRDRVITRRDNGEFKSLNLVLAEQRGVIILDDTPDVWHDHMSNLLIIKRYYYFKSRDSKSELEKIDEDEKDCALMKALQILERLHTEFFSEESTDDRDVREMLMPHNYSCYRGFVLRCLTS